MGMIGPFFDERRGDTIQAYYVCEGAVDVSYKSSSLKPRWGAYISREVSKNGGVHLRRGMTTSEIFGTTKTMPPGIPDDDPITIDKSKSSVDQIYAAAKKLPKAKDFQDVLEDGQVVK